MKKSGVLFILVLFSFLFLTDPVLALVEMEPSGIKVVNGSGGSTYTRMVATAIGIYTKNGVVPGVHKYRGEYAGVSYNVLEVDTTDTNGTFLQVDYAGYNSSDYLPKYLNNFYDKELTANDEYYWVGSINAGFFTATSSSNMYGYPTGAVKKNGNWLTYISKDGSNTLETAPSYGSGFVTAYFNKNNEFKLIYNGWKDGVFYKYAGDPDPNSWDYGEHVNYSEGVSGAYTLIVDGDSSVHWGKGDYSGTDFWNYSGTAVTLFGQKANGNYVLVTTEGTLNAESQVELMVELGCVNAIRFDGGGSTQMAYDEGLILNHFYFGKTNTNIEKGTSLDTSDISFDLYMEDETYYWASAADVPQAEYLIYDTSWEEVEDISQAEVGDYWLKVLMNGLEQTIKISVVESQDTHIVTFEYEDGETSPVKKSVESGKTVEEPETPTREGYTFVEWQLDGKPYDFKTAVTEDITLKAVWDINEYQIQFDTDGGTPVDTQTKEYLSVVDKPENPTKTGYTFVEWQLNGEPYDFETKVTDHMTLKAVWKINEYQIQFDTDGGTPVDTQTKEYLSVVDKPENPTKTGYTFVEWQLNGEPYNFETKVTDHMTLKAVWKINEYQIQFDTDGGTAVDTQTKEYLSVVDKPENPTKTGYTFVEWQLDGEPYDFETKVTDHMTLKAVWKINEYQIQFDTDGGTPVDTQTKEYLSVVDKPENPIKEGYTFVEWQLDGEPYDFETKVTDHMTLKAVWKIAPLDIEESSGYKVNGKYIELPFGIVSSNLSLGLSDIYNIKVYSVKGEVKQSEKIATGDKVQISLDDTLVAEYIVIVKGDTTGDGNISIVDVGKLYQYLKNKITMDECYVLAGDVVMDEEIRITDVGKLYQFIKGKISNLEN